MPDQVKVVVLEGPGPIELTDRDIAPNVNRHPVAKVEVSLEGNDRRFVFYTLPAGDESYIWNFQGAVRVLARVPWFFGKSLLSNGQDVYLQVIIKNGKITTFKLGNHQEGDLLAAIKNRKTFKILDLPFAGAFRELPREIARDVDLEPQTALRGAFSPVRRPDQKGDCVPSKDWTPVFEQRVKLEADQLRAFGAQEKVSSTPVRLLQIPGVLACGDEGPFTAQTWYVAILGLPYAWGRAIWNNLLAEQIRVSLLDIQHGSLFAPVFTMKGDPNLLWNMIYELKRYPKDWDEIPLAHSLELAAVGANLSAQADLPLLRNHLGQSITAKFPLPLSPVPQANVELSTWDSLEGILEDVLRTIRTPGLSLRLRTDKAVAVTSTNRSVRIGALDFTFAGDLGTRERKDVPYLRWNLLRSERSKITQESEPGFDYRYDWYDAQIDIDWAIDRISPGGQDDLNGEFYADCDPTLKVSNSQKEEHELECLRQRERPLVVPLSENKATGIVLNVQESARQGDVRRIDLVMRRIDGGGDSGDELKGLKVCSPENEKKLDRVAVLDREPFLVAKVSFPSLGSLKDPTSGNEFANWRSYGSDAGAWHVRFPDAQNFCLTLPPQGVGETMEKRKKDGQGLEEGKLADFRLSPPAFLAMRERYYQQNFPEAPWNLRRLLSDPERELPGAQLEHLQYELLYGLSCRIDYPFMRFAEVSALVGDVMGPLPQRPAWVPLKKGVADIDALKRYFETRKDWGKLAKRTRQRLGIFELWDIRKLDTLELKENVTCWIRQMPGDHQLPGNRTDEPIDGSRPKTLPDELVIVPKADLANPVPEDPKAPNPGLKGGVTWGFESRNIYQAVLRPTDKWPRSSGAEMKEMRLSTLGGWGHQTAAFDNWRTKILADVSMGRTYSYTLERIGRIGVWWNRAKHVIVYERTVVRSRLFGPDVDGEPDAQSKHEGRAVLRKVDEYVEILQNTRKYPDQDKGDAKATGCINECCFSEDPNQVIRFRVRGSWGTDVGKEGWKIPIWRPGEEPADLFPKLKVHLTVMASVDGKSEPRKVTIADPENLFFYTDTTVPPEALDNPSVDLSNTDAWVPVEGVDFVDQARPRPAADPAFASGSLQQSSPGDTVIPVGFRPCTFQIEPAEHTVDLLANRKGDPMGSLLSSVTMCRADLNEEVSAFSNVIVTAKSEVSKFIEQGIAAIPADPRRFDPSAIDASFKDLCTQVSGKVNKALSGPRAQLDEAAGRIKGAKELVNALHEQAIQSITQGTQRLLRFPKEFATSLQTDKGKLKTALELEVDKMLGQVTLLPSLTAYLSDVQGALYATQIQLKSARAELEGIVRPGLETWLGGEPLFPRLPELLQRLKVYRAQLQGISRKVRELTETSAKLDQAGKTVTVGLGPRWISTKLEFQKLAASLEKVDAMLAAAENLAATLPARRKQFKDLLEARLKDLEAQAKTLDTMIDRAAGFVETLRTKLKDAEEKRLAQVSKFTKTVLGAALDAIGPVDNPGNVNLAAVQAAWEGALKKPAETLETDLRGALAEVHTGAEQFFAGLEGVEHLIPSADMVQTKVSEQCQVLKESLDNLLKDIKDKLDLEAQAAEVRRFLERYRDEAVQAIESQLGGGIKAARQMLGVVESKKDDVLKLVRAFGKPPDVSGLEFDRPEVAFFYNELKDRVDVTPVIARAAQAAAIVEALKPFGVDLPVKQLGEQLIPEELKNFDVSSILPNIAGIPLKDLFSSLKMPAGSGDAVKVRHGIDPQTRRAWVNTEINFQSSENATLFAVGPLAVRINQPHFQAEARMEADLQKVRKKKVSGQLTGDWLLQIGGFPLITFRQTPLTFDDDGRINFRVNPKDVQLAPALDFINELMTTISPGGLSTRFDGDGVVSTLDLPIPDTQIGAFGFSGLRLCASMALRYGGEFNIGVTAGLARRDAPFTLTIFILGGAGYLELGSRYVPATGKVYATADMAIAVSASLAIALGPIRGGVAVYIGVTANYDSQRGGGLVVGLMFMVRGHVSVLSIASATITLRLDGQYQNGAMVGRGHLEIKIKICWCFTLEVSESVTYTLGRVGSSKQSQSRLGGPRPVAQLASLQGIPTGGAAAEPEDRVDPKLLWMRVEDYLDMLV